MAYASGVWDGKIVLAVDNRRCKYMAEQVLTKAKEGTEPYHIARKVLKVLGFGRDLGYTTRYDLENKYRGIVLRQQIHTAVSGI